MFTLTKASNNIQYYHFCLNDSHISCFIKLRLTLQLYKKCYVSGFLLLESILVDFMYYVNIFLGQFHIRSILGY